MLLVLQPEPARCPVVERVLHRDGPAAPCIPPGSRHPAGARVDRKCEGSTDASAHGLNELRLFPTQFIDAILYRKSRERTDG